MAGGDSVLPSVFLGGNGGGGVYDEEMEVRSLVLRLGCGVWVAVVSGDDALVGKSDNRVYREGGG